MRSQFPTTLAGIIFALSELLCFADFGNASELSDRPFSVAWKQRGREMDLQGSASGINSNAANKQPEPPKAVTNNCWSLGRKGADQV